MEHRNNKYFLSLSVLILIMFATLQSCYYDNEEYLYPDLTDCATDNMSFASDVWPVINASCTGCHSGGSPEGGILLTNYTEVKAQALIGAGNYGSLYGVISHASGNSPMPKNSDRLPACTIVKIKAWIDQGAQDN